MITALQQPSKGRSSLHAPSLFREGAVCSDRHLGTATPSPATLPTALTLPNLGAALAP